MWDALPTTPLGTLTWRKLLAMVTLFLVTVFAYMLVTTPLAHAADITWQGSDLIYQNNPYKGPSTASNGDGRDLPAGSTYYTHMEPQVPFAPQKVDVIYFPPGTDPTKATSAQFVTYEMGPGGGLTNKSSPKQLSTDATTAPGTPNNPTGSKGSSGGGSCQVDGNLGWLICPLTNTIAAGMDGVFDIMSSFLEVRPLETTNNGIMMKVWNIMRNFANVAFVIAFIIIIYSQLTSIGLSNYGIKKILPRLIIAAILVNISYWICAVAIDLSNILGYAFQGLFEGMRGSILDGVNMNGWKLVDWQTVTAFVLAGGAATIGATVAWTALAAHLGAFTVTTVALFLLPVLLSVFMVVLVVLFILAARQAIITLFVILSPLAFVAYILPNTEKWFDRWKDTFTTMLVFFPLFSLAFGGAQLAGLIIIHNSTTITMVIFGLAVQIAPLAITPLILKLSGGLLGRIAGVVNNPSKGLVDRTRNWSNDRLAARRAAEMARTRAMARNGTLSPFSVMRRTAMHHDDTRRMREGLKAINEEQGTALFDASNRGYTLARAKQLSTNDKTQIDNRVKERLQQEVNTSGSQLHISNVDVEASNLRLKRQTDKTAAIIEEYKEGNATAGAGANSTYLSRVARNMNTDVEAIALIAMRNEAAKHKQNEEFTKAMQNNSRTIEGKTYQEYAGGIQGLVGSQRSLASAINAQSKAHSDTISNAKTIIRSGNYTDATIRELALGRSGTSGIVVTDDIKEAAVEMIFSGGNTAEILKLARDIDLTPHPGNSEYRQSAGDTLLSNSGRPKFIGAGVAAGMKEGTVPPPGKARLDTWVVNAANDDKFNSAETFVTQDKEYLLAVLDTFKNNTSGKAFDTDKLIAMKKQLHLMATDNRYKGRIGERKQALKELYNTINVGDVRDEHGRVLPRTILDD